MDRKTIDNIVWWIPFRKLRNSVREVLNEISNNTNSINNINSKLDVVILNNTITEARAKLKYKIISTRNIKIIVGAGPNNYDGFISTDIDLLNITKEDDWLFYFKENSISNILAEHVLEHIDYNDTKIALSFAYKHLKMGGVFRIAVPDGYHPSEEYIEYVKPNGIGAGSDDHKLLYNFETIKQLFENTGFNIDILEYWDRDGEFHFKKFSITDGIIHRSKDFDKRNKDGKLNYTSLIIDAIKI